MTRPASKIAQARKAVSQFEAVGKSVAAVDFLPNGGFRLLLGEKVDVSADLRSDAGNEWDEVLPGAR